MRASLESADFWNSDELWIAANPHRSGDADGLVEFASRNEATRSLLYFQTSGTEGVPKWVGISRTAFQASATAVNAHLEATAKDRWIVALPLNHVGGFSIFARCFISGAACFRFEEKWNARQFTAVCETEKITLTSLVPTQVFDLVQARQQAPKSMRAVVVGGGGLSRELGMKATELGWPLLQSFGMTETASQIATEPMDHLYAGFDPERLEVLPIWNLQTDEDGRLTVRGEALASGYALKEDGNWKWQPLDSAEGLRTRDFVSVWDHGARRFLRVLGREAEIVKVLGELVNVAVLQKRLDQILISIGHALAAAAIWTVTDERKGTKLILVGTLAESELEKIKTRFNEAVHGVERLDEWRRITVMPRTALGKLDRAALSEMLSAR